MVVGAVHHELGVRVAAVGRRQRLGRLGDVHRRVVRVDVDGGRLGQRHGRFQPHLAEGVRVERPVGVGVDGAVGDVHRDDDPLADRPGVGGEQPQRTVGGPRQRRVLQLLDVVGDVPLAQAGRDGVGGERPGPQFARPVRLGESRQGQGDVDAHEGPFPWSGLDAPRIRVRRPPSEAGGAA